MSSSLIIHTEASDGWGGQEMRILKELLVMRARGYRVALAAPSNSEIFKHALSEKIDCWPVSFSKLSRISDMLYLAARFAKEKPLMVGTHSSADSWVGLIAAKLAGVPVTLRYRHVSVPVGNNFLNRFLYRLPDAIVTTGGCICRALVESLKLPPEKLRTIATGIIPPENLPTRDAARAALQKKLGLPVTARFIGMSAVFRSWKGHQYLMEAFELLKDKYPNYYLILVGGGSSLGYYKDLAAKTSVSARIHFAGTADARDYFRAFDCALLASTRNEGIPQSLLEAMFFEVPVVGTDVGGIPEIVQHGRTGLIVPPCNAGALAGAIDEVLSNTAAAEVRVQEALIMVRQNYTIDKMADKVEALIKEVAVRKGK